MSDSLRLHSEVTLSNFLIVVLLLGSDLVTMSSSSSRRNYNPSGSVGSELGDYRLMNGEPFVSLFEHENFRGEVFKQRISKDCANIPEMRDNWASSIILHGRCAILCEDKDCKGACKTLYPDNSRGVQRLTKMGLNDKASSVKFCYRLLH